MAGPIDSAFRALGDLDEYAARAGQNPAAQAAVDRVRAAMGVGAAPTPGATPGWFARNLPSMTPYGADAGRAAGAAGRVASFVAPAARIAGGVAALASVPGVAARTYDEVFGPNSVSSRATLPYRQAADAAGPIAGILPRLQAFGVGMGSIANQAVLQPALRLAGSRVANEAAAPAAAPAAPVEVAAPPAAAAAPRLSVREMVDSIRGSMTQNQMNDFLARIPPPMRPQGAADQAGNVLLRMFEQQNTAIDRLPVAEQRAQRQAMINNLLGLARANPGLPMLNQGAE